MFSGFDVSFRSSVAKVCHFPTLCWVNKDGNIAKQIFPAHKNIFLKVTENKLIV